MDANLYLLSNRFSNSKFFVLPAINYNNKPALKQEFAKSLDEKEPKFIIVKQELRTQNNLNDERLDLTVSDKIKKKYKKVEVSNNESQDYQIFKIR